MQLATFAMHLLLAWGNSTGDNLAAGVLAWERSASFIIRYVCWHLQLILYVYVTPSIDHISRGKFGCRIVSRGKLSSQASDFGGLEVFASASIGHTDPFVVSTALQKAMLKVDNAAANTA